MQPKQDSNVGLINPNEKPPVREGKAVDSVLRHTHSEHQLIHFCLDAARIITTIPFEEKNIEIVRDRLDSIQRLYNAAIEERNLGKWSVFSQKVE